MRIAAVLLLCLSGQMAVAEIVVPTRTIRAREIITAEDIALKSATVAGAISHPSDVIGKEARVALYAGRPMRAADVGVPALIGRNQIVPLVFTRGGLSIHTEGRALDRAAAGETVRVMNLSSRATVSGIVRADGTIEVR